MCLTDLMLPNVIKYFHEVTVHNEGMVWLEQMIWHWFYHPQITEQVKQHVQGYLICQKMKHGACGYGELRAHSVNAPPWHKVHVDCIGPWTIELCGGHEYQFNALTSIDPTTNLLEIEELPRKTAQACADAFESGWLVCYPCPT